MLGLHVTLDEDFREYFGDDYSIEEITRGLTSQDDRVFTKVNEIYKLKMGTSFPVAGQESLQDFIRVTSKQYCGPGKPFAGLLIIFDEFGRYIEFAAQKPHVAGPAALQQLYEAVQENAGSVFLLAFIQTELRAYASRVMPERRDEIERYLTRFDSVRKVRLSTNRNSHSTSYREKGLEGHKGASIQPSTRLHSFLHGQMVSRSQPACVMAFSRSFCQSGWGRLLAIAPGFNLGALPTN